MSPDLRHATWQIEFRHVCTEAGGKAGCQRHQARSAVSFPGGFSFQGYTQAGVDYT